MYMIRKYGQNLKFAYLPENWLLMKVLYLNLDSILKGSAFLGGGLKSGVKGAKVMKNQS